MTEAERNLIKSKKLFLFDMDGTLYLGEQLFPFTAELLATIRRSGRRYLFLTNNSSKSTADYIAKMERLGIAASAEDFLSSTEATVKYLSEHLPTRHFYVVGTESLKRELRASGFAIEEDADSADALLIGFDTELTFKKLDDASRMLCTRDIPYIATHPDDACPTEYGYVPDCGALAEMLYRASGKRPDAVIGKPQPLMPEMAMERAGCTKAESVMIGDRINTDVMSGINAGITGILVMSGATTEEILAASTDRPTITLSDAGELLQALR